jgi:hypothetical protein
VRLLLRPSSRLLRRTTSGLLGRTLASLGPFALELGVTQRVLLALIGIATTVVSVLVFVAVSIASG